MDEQRWLEAGIEASGDRGLPLARPSACLCDLAFAGRTPTVRVAGAGRLVLVGDGETLCAFTAGHLASDVERFGAKVGIPEPSGYDLATLKEAALSDIAPTL